MRYFYQLILILTLVVGCQACCTDNYEYTVEYAVYYPNEIVQETITLLGPENLEISTSSYRGTNYIQTGFGRSFGHTTCPIRIISIKKKGRTR